MHTKRYSTLQERENPKKHIKFPLTRMVILSFKATIMYSMCVSPSCCCFEFVLSSCDLFSNYHTLYAAGWQQISGELEIKFGGGKFTQLPFLSTATRAEISCISEKQTLYGWLMRHCLDQYGNINVLL